jgi:hypothetical protein
MKMNRTLSTTSVFVALLYLAGLGGCATLSKEDRALLESTRQSAEEAKATGARVEKAAAGAEQAAAKATSAAERAEAAALKAERIFDKSLKK